MADLAGVWAVDIGAGLRERLGQRAPCRRHRLLRPQRSPPRHSDRPGLPKRKPRDQAREWKWFACVVWPSHGVVSESCLFCVSVCLCACPGRGATVAPRDASPRDAAPRDAACPLQYKYISCWLALSLPHDTVKKLYRFYNDQSGTLFCADSLHGRSGRNRKR
eukprot:3763437-Rhodomonas_salina.2